MSKFDIDKALRKLLDLQDNITHENEVGTDNQRYIWGLQRERRELVATIKAKFEQVWREGAELAIEVIQETIDAKTPGNMSIHDDVIDSVLALTIDSIRELLEGENEEDKDESRN